MPDQDSTKKIKILAVGFGSNKYFVDNISGAVATALEERFGKDGFELVSLVQPINENVSEAKEFLRGKLDEIQPDVIIPMGQDGMANRKIMREYLRQEHCPHNVPRITYNGNAINEYAYNRDGYLGHRSTRPVRIEQDKPQGYERNALIHRDLIPTEYFDEGIRNNIRAHKKGVEPKPILEPDRDGYTRIDRDGRETTGNYLCNFSHYECLSWAAEQQAQGKPKMVSPFLHLLNTYGPPGQQEAFINYYVDKAETLAIRTARVAEVKKVAADPEHPHHALASEGILHSGKRAVIASVQHLLVEQGFLKATAINPFPIDGFWGPNTRGAIEQYIASTGHHELYAQGKVNWKKALDIIGETGAHEKNEMAMGQSATPTDSMPAPLPEHTPAAEKDPTFGGILDAKNAEMLKTVMDNHQSDAEGVLRYQKPEKNVQDRATAIIENVASKAGFSRR